MLYAVSGSQGVGKSTTLDLLKYNKIDRKTSRSILADWDVTLNQVNNDIDLSKRFQDEILKRKREDEMRAVISNDIWLTERTYMDLFVYAAVNLGNNNDHTAWLDEYYSQCVEFQETYDHVFYIKAGFFAPVYDGVRSVNSHYSTIVDLALEHYTKKTSRGMSIIDTSDQHTRLEIINNQIKQGR